MGRRRAFTLVEIIATLLLLGVISLIAVPALLGVLRSQGDSAGTAQLAAARLDGRVIALNYGYRYPADIVDLLVARDPRFTTGPSTSPETISVHRVDDTTLLYAMVTDGGSCVAVVEDIQTDVGRWGIAPPDTTCSAAAVEAVEATLVGDETSPTQIEL